MPAPNRGCGFRTHPGRSASTIADTSTPHHPADVLRYPATPSPGDFGHTRQTLAALRRLHAHHDPPSLIDVGLSRRRDPTTGQRHNLIEGRPGWPATSPVPSRRSRASAHDIRGPVRADRPGPATTATWTPGCDAITSRARSVVDSSLADVHPIPVGDDDRGAWVVNHGVSSSRCPVPRRLAPPGSKPIGPRDPIRRHTWSSRGPAAPRGRPRIGARPMPGRRPRPGTAAWPARGARRAGRA